MTSAHEDVATGGRRRGRRDLGWCTVFCFGTRHQRAQEASSAEGTTTPWERSSRRRRKKRTVPMDADLVGTAADSVAMRRGSGSYEEARKREGLRVPGRRCFCILVPGRAPEREHSAMDGSSGLRPQQTTAPRAHGAAAPAAVTTQSEMTSHVGSILDRSHRWQFQQRQPLPPSRAVGAKSGRTAAVVGAFGPAVGLPVVVTVSLVGLLGGRLWAVVCVCAWLAALSRLGWREATTTAPGEVAVHVDSTDHKEPVVLRGLLE